MSTSVAQSAPLTPDKLKVAARAGKLHTLFGESLTERGLRLAARKGELDDLVEDDRLAGLGEDHLVAVQEEYAERPSDRVLGFLVGKLAAHVRHEAAQKTETEVAEVRRRRLQARVEYLRFNEITDNDFWRLIASEHGNVCPFCGASLHGYGSRVGQFQLRCGYRDFEVGQCSWQADVRDIARREAANAA